MKLTSKDVAILDFGSQKITVLVGCKDVNNTIIVKGHYEEPYDGFMDGEFLSPDMLQFSIKNAILGIQRACNCKIMYLTVGVPTEFCYSTCQTVSQSFLKPKRITSEDIDNLFSSVSFDLPTHTLVNKDAIYYVLGENNRVSSPIGQVDSKISACLSYVLVENSFLSTISKALIKCDIVDFNFVSSAYAQGLYLFDDEEREKYALMVDCGYITTTVALFRGRGVLNLSSFSLGGGNIIADLSTCLKIPFDSAESLLRKVVLSIKPKENECYEIATSQGILPISMGVANAIVESRIEDIAKAIRQCFSTWKYQFPDFITIKLTGGGIAFLKGGKDVLARSLGRNVEIVKLAFGELSKYNHSSCMAVLDYALSNN